MSQGARPGVGRRAAIGGALGAVVVGLGGCGVRLEDDAPRVPLLPTRTPVPAEAELVALTRGTAGLATLAAATTGELPADLATIHRRQQAVLRTTLVRDQVPPESLDASASGAPSASASADPSPSASVDDPAAERQELADEEARSAAGSGSFAGVEESLLAPVAALHAQRYAAATLLSGRRPEVPSDPVTGEDVADLARRTAASLWFLEVVAARSTGRQRSRADATLEALRGLLADQVAGGSRPADTLGHPLPFPVESPADGARLARRALTSLRTEHGAALEGLVREHGAAGAQGATRWLGTVEVEAHRWGVALQPFPGLT